MRRHRHWIAVECSAIGGSSEVEEVEYWVGLREASQWAGEVLKE